MAAAGAVARPLDPAQQIVWLYSEFQSHRDATKLFNELYDWNLNHTVFAGAEGHERFPNADRLPLAIMQRGRLSVVIMIKEAYLTEGAEPKLRVVFKDLDRIRSRKRNYAVDEEDVEYEAGMTITGDLVDTDIRNDIFGLSVKDIDPLKKAEGAKGNLVHVRPHVPNIRGGATAQGRWDGGIPPAAFEIVGTLDHDLSEGDRTVYIQPWIVGNHAVDRTGAPAVMTVDVLGMYDITSFPGGAEDIATEAPATLEAIARAVRNLAGATVGGSMLANDAVVAVEDDPQTGAVAVRADGTRLPLGEPALFANGEAGAGYEKALGRVFTYTYGDREGGRVAETLQELSGLPTEGRPRGTGELRRVLTALQGRLADGDAPDPLGTSGASGAAQDLARAQAEVQAAREAAARERAEAQAAREETERARAAAADLGKQLASEERDAAALRAALANLELEAAGLRAANAEIAERLAQTENEKDAAESERNRAIAGRQATQAALDDEKRRAQQLRDELDAIDAGDLDALKLELKERDAELLRALEDGVEAQRQAQENLLNAEDARKDLEDANTRIDELEAEVAALRAALPPPVEPPAPQPRPPAPIVPGRRTLEQIDADLDRLRQEYLRTKEAIARLERRDWLTEDDEEELAELRGVADGLFTRISALVRERNLVKLGI